jgi:hypothetical protein
MFSRALKQEAVELIVKRDILQKAAADFAKDQL